MFEEFDSKYDDFCWFEIKDEHLKSNLEKQAKLEISHSSPLFELKDKLVAIAKSARQDDVLYYDSEKYYVIHFRVISKGALIASIGDETKYSGLMLSGTARSYYIDSEGNDITRGFAVEGSLFMDEGLYGYKEYMCVWEALEDSTIMLFETSKVRSLILSNEVFKDLWICLLELTVRYKLYRENGFLVENATERYIHFKKMYPDVCNRVPQKHIATYLGITPESLSRIRSAMKEE